MQVYIMFGQMMINIQPGVYCLVMVWVHTPQYQHANFPDLDVQCTEWARLKIAGGALQPCQKLVHVLRKAIQKLKRMFLGNVQHLIENYV